MEDTYVSDANALKKKRPTKRKELAEFLAQNQTQATTVLERETTRLLKERDWLSEKVKKLSDDHAQLIEDVKATSRKRGIIIDEITALREAIRQREAAIKARDKAIVSKRIAYRELAAGIKERDYIKNKLDETRHELNNTISNLSRKLEILTVDYDRLEMLEEWYDSTLAERIRRPSSKD